MTVLDRSIRPLDPSLIAQIKAGEVIERPASVVKELLENAIDAEASTIRIEVQEGGIRLIRVIDNGCGIPAESLEMAFAEHTSSKLHSTDDLDRIDTLGFRGEALYAISNVAVVEAISAVRGNEAARAVTFDHGSLVGSEPAALGGGTRLTVRDLFAKVPARRKHLRSPRSEAAAIQQVVALYAIGHPSIAVTLLSENRTVFASSGSGKVAEAFASVYGFDLVDKMVPLRLDGLISVSGLVSPPSLTRPNRSSILLFVNGRPIKSPALVFAVEDAMTGLLMVGRHPLAAICIGVPADHVDANVHPTKQEVRFVADRAVFSAVRAAVMEAMTGVAGTRELTAPVIDATSFRIAAQDMAEPERRPYPENITFDSVQPEPRASPLPALPHLKVFGQAAQTFIVAEGPAGLYMIDQHAAHERILFDALTAREGPNDCQPLLEPETVVLTASQLGLVEEHSDLLRATGFDVELFGGDVCRVRGVPMVGGRVLAPPVVVDVIDALIEAGSANGVMRQALTVVACKAAVKAGDGLTMAEMRQLVDSLEATSNPRTCPHGRPTTIHISTDRLEREFGRR